MSATKGGCIGRRYSDETALPLPEACRLLIVERMDNSSRAVWRVVSRQACQDVYLATKRLTWRVDEVTSVPLPLHTPLDREPNSLPTQLLSKLPSLYHLGCRDMSSLRSIHGVPLSLRSVDLTNARSMLDLSPLHQCTALEQLTIQHEDPSLDAVDARAYLTVLRSYGPLLSLLRRCEYSKSKNIDPNKALMQSLAPLSNLQRLGLSLGFSYWHDFAPILSQMSDLRHVSFRYAEVAAIAPAIGQLKQLRSLQLTEADLSSGGSAALAQALMSLPAQLTVLELQVWSSHRYRATLDLALGRALQVQSTTLRSLHLKTCSLEADSMAALAPGLMHCTALTELSLAGTFICRDAVPALGAVLSAVAPSLTSLVLSEAIAVEFLAPALGAMTGLKTLTLNLGSYSPEELRVLVSVLQPLPLQQWTVTGYELGEGGGKVLASCLSAMHSLRHFALLTKRVDSIALSLTREAATILPGLTIDYPQPHGGQ